MGWFRPDRTPRAGADRWLVPKMSLFVIGAAIAILGIGLGREWLVDVAIAVLVVGVLLRFIPGRKSPPDDRADG